MRPELILWDWNGTLLDDVELCENALNRLLQRYGYPQPDDHEQYRAIFGFPVQDYYARAGFDFTRDSFDDLARSFMEDYIPASEACPLMAGAREALDAFARAGLHQVILPSPPWNIRWRCEGLPPILTDCWGWVTSTPKARWPWDFSIWHRLGSIPGGL